MNSPNVEPEIDYGQGISFSLNVLNRSPDEPEEIDFEMTSIKTEPEDDYNEEISFSLDKLSQSSDDELNVSEELITDEMNDDFCNGETHILSNSLDSTLPEEPPPPKRKKVDIHIPAKRKLRYKGMQGQKLQAFIDKDLIGFCQELGLIASSVACFCGNKMTLIGETGRGCYQWTCSKSIHPQQRMAFRKGTWFEKFKLPVEDVLWIAYMWIHEYSQVSLVHEAAVSVHAVNECTDNFVDASRAILEFKTAPIGGDNKLVEIFEFTGGEDKSRTGKKVMSDPWIFFAMEMDSCNSCLLNVPNYSSETILDVLSESLLPHTIVFTHIWNPYRNVRKDHFEYLLNHKCLTFADATTKKEITTFVQLHKLTKRPRPGANRFNKNIYNLDVCERFYRRCLSNAPDAFCAFMKDVAMVFKPLTVWLQKTENGSD